MKVWVWPPSSAPGGGRGTNRWARTGSGFILPALIPRINRTRAGAGISAPAEHHWSRREVGTLTPEQGNGASVPSGTSKMYPSPARPATLGCRSGTRRLLFTPISPTGMGRGPALRKSHTDLSGFVGTRKNPSEKRRRRGPLAPGAAPPFDVGPGLGGLAAPAPRCHPQVNKDQHNCLLVY